MRTRIEKERERKAEALVSSGFVTRRGDGFIVRNPESLSDPAEFVVRRDTKGAITCDCGEARRNPAPDFRCDHMLAVRLAIRTRRSEDLPPRSGNVLNFTAARSARSPLDKGRDSDEPFGAEALDRFDPGWSHSVKQLRQIGNFFAVTVAVTACGVTREGIGTGAVADPRGIESAERTALRSAIAKFGNCAPLKRSRPDFPAEPVARSLFDLVTAKQLGIVRSLARELGIHAERECERLLHCSVGELSKAAATAFIEHIGSMRHGNNFGEMRLAG